MRHTLAALFLSPAIAYLLSYIYQVSIRATVRGSPVVRQTQGLEYVWGQWEETVLTRLLASQTPLGRDVPSILCYYRDLSMQE
jgi:hypothetical protein